MKPRKVALVCDWLIGGGAERVVAELHKMYPEAPIYTSYCTDKWRSDLDNKVITGYLQKRPFSKLRKFLPVLRGLWFSRLDLSGYDLVISASGAEAKYIKAKAKTVHVSYIHAPTHYYWNRYDEYLKNPGFGAYNWLARVGLRLLVGPMRRWDYKAAQRPDYLIANSTHTKEQIKKYYNRDSQVIFPPVNIVRFKGLAKNDKRSGFVCVGRLAPYKRIDLAVKACTKLDQPLTILGGGPELQNLQNIAGLNVRFNPMPTDEDINQALGSSAGFIFPGLDDFGIAPVEALAAGTPVIAYKSGGALDYIQDGKNGRFFNKQNSEELIKTLKNFHVSLPSDEISKTVQKFSQEKFKTNIREHLASR